MKDFTQKLKTAMILVALVTLPAGYALAAGCSPVSAEMCAAIDDIADVYINSVFVGTFEYVNWDETGVYPSCKAFPVTILAETGNVVALDVLNTECCEIWGSWSIEVQCADGSHSCLTSDDMGMELYNVMTPSDTPPPDVGGYQWWQKEYQQGTPTPGCTPLSWCSAVLDSGTIYGKLIYNPCTGKRLQPLSYDTSGSGPTPGNHIYMRQPFDLQTATPLGPPNFTITKALVTATPSSKTTDFNTNDRVYYQIVVCNSGEAEVGDVLVTDDFDNGFSYDGPYGGDCAGYGDGSPCFEGHGGYFTIKWARGFEGASCVTMTVRVVDYWVDRYEWCQVRPNVAGVHWASAEPDAQSSTINVTMYCPGTATFTLTRTMSRTITPTFTITETKTITPTITMTPTRTVTSTRTRIPSITYTPTNYPTNYTRTYTNTITVTPSRTRTPTPTITATPTVTMTWVNAITLIKSQDCWVVTTPPVTPTQCEVPLGDTVRYCIEFTNQGLGDATFEIWDTIPGPMDFLWCTTESDGTDCDINTFSSGACFDYEGSPVHGCRVISWHMVAVPPGSVGSVCYWVLVARLQTAEKEKTTSEYFAFLDRWFDARAEKYGLKVSRIKAQEYIRGPD